MTPRPPADGHPRRAWFTSRVLGWTLLLLPWWLSANGCGGRSVGGGPVGASDGAAAPVDGDVPGVFCSGSAKMSYGGLSVSVPVTASPIVMDCCDGATLRFHGRDRFTFDAVVMIRAQMLWTPGEYRLEDLPAGLEVQVSRAGDQEWLAQTLEGSLRVTQQGGGWDDPLALALCLTATSDSPDLEGLKLHVPDQVVMPFGWYERLAVWLLDDTSIDAHQASLRPLGSLVLDDQPVITLGNFNYYELDTHTVYWDAWYSSRLSSLLAEIDTAGLPFVVTADDERIYLGAFFTSVSSEGFDGPVIVVDDQPEGQATIERAYPSGSTATGPDPRADPRILAILRDSGKLVE